MSEGKIKATFEKKEDIEAFRRGLAGIFLAGIDWNLQAALGVLNELDTGWGPGDYETALEVFRNKLDEDDKETVVQEATTLTKVKKVPEGYLAEIKVHNVDISDLQNWANDIDDIAKALARVAMESNAIAVEAEFEYTIGMDLEPVYRDTKVYITRQGKSLHVKVTHTGPEDPGCGEYQTWESEFEISTT